MERNEIESLMNRSMDSVAGDYATRVAFAMDRLAITERRDRMIPVAELAERLSKILGRHVDQQQFLALAQAVTDDRTTLEAMGRMLEVEVGWLATEFEPQSDE